MNSRIVLRLPRIARVWRIALPLLIAAGCFWLLLRQLEGVDALGALAKIPGWSWVSALAATGLSFWAVGRYDAVAHRHLNTGVRTRTAHMSGACAIAFSQAVGFGLVTGTLARWRLLPGLPWTQAAQLTVFVALSFLTALAVLIGFITLIAPLPGQPWLPALALLALPLVVLVAFFVPVVRVGRYHLTLPSLPAIGAIGLWTVIDTAAAALALWLLMPSGELPWGVVYPAYLVALGAALISGTPGGAGPFELTLVLLTPPGTEAAVIAAILAFRVIYFLVPAVVSGVTLWRWRFEPVSPGDAGGLAELPDDLARAETAVVRQPGGQVLRAGDAAVAAIVTPQVVAGLFDPISGHMDDVLRLLWVTARSGNRLACLYKCNARSAARARRAGWKVQRIAREAVISTARFDPAGAQFRQLRRKLRSVEKAGVTIGLSVDIGDLRAVDAAWQRARGRARGTTIGRFDQGYLAQQRVFVATLDGRAVAFASFHTSHREWCLDLVRWSDGVPDGTMHALVAAAIRAAAKASVPRLSLAAVPDHAVTRRTGKGLVQFKESFAPDWQPLYLAAPDAAALALAAADLARAVRWPDAGQARATKDPHEDVEQKGFAMT